MLSGYLQARRFRTTGQPQKALEVLSIYNEERFTNEPQSKPLILLETATCHLMLHQFRKVLVDTQKFKSLGLSPKCREAGLSRLLYAAARIHTDLTLQEAWSDAKEVGLWHIGGLEASKADALDIELVCMYCVIESRVIQLLDVEPPEFSPSDVFFDKLRLHLLGEQRIEDLATIHVHQRQMQHRTFPEDSLETTLANVDPDDMEMQVHMRIIIALACKRQADLSSALQHLDIAHADRLSTRTFETHLFSQYLEIRLRDVATSQSLNLSKALLETSQKDGNYYLSELLECWISEAELRVSSESDYERSVRNMLEKSHSFHLPPLTDVPTIVMNQDDTSEPIFSADGFWQWYLSRINEDMKYQKRARLVAHCCRRFLDHMVHCSIPEMKYTLMSVLAEFYEEKGDLSHAISWIQKARMIANEIDDEELHLEVECTLRLLLADEAVIVLDDPYGIKKAEWETSRFLDLEIWFNDARDRKDWSHQFKYARKLLEKELEQEIRKGEPPCGREWYPLVCETLNNLDPESQSSAQLKVEYLIAHAKFKAQDFRDCVSACTSVFEESFVVSDIETASRALFTSARANLELFKQTDDFNDWQKSEAALLQCYTLLDEEKNPDMIACCHILQAILWHARKETGEMALTKSLDFLTKAQRIWSMERSGILGSTGLDTLLTHYAMTGRNAKTPHSTYGLAVEICFRLDESREAYYWAECGKAQAFYGRLMSNELAVEPSLGLMPGQEEVLRPLLDEPALLVHWVSNGEDIFMCACRNSCEYFVYKLGIKMSAVEEWHQNLVTSRDNLSEPDQAGETLAELEALCRPIVENKLAHPGELVILCPTKVLFRIPIHAIPLSDGLTLLDHYPIVYTHSFSVLRTLLRRRQLSREPSESGITLMGNATGDTPAGEISVRRIAKHIDTPSLTSVCATKTNFIDAAPTSQLVHIHGHITLDAYPLDQSILFHDNKVLKAREVFELSLATSHPLVILIGCGSGHERHDSGDEPLGLVSGFLHAGASTVVATMWPIHDRLSGAAFSEAFYGLDETDADGIRRGRTVDIARRLQQAALSLKAKEETRAPYFWAGFLIHGDWHMHLN